MERLIESSVVLGDAAFGQSLQKIVFNTRKSFEHFRSAVDTCKAIFKSKSYDGKEKFYALLILKEVTRVAEGAQFDYFVDKAAKRMKDFAIFNRKAPINTRGETCLEEFKKGTNKAWSQRFFELNLECWSAWVAQSQNYYDSKKAKKLQGFAESIRDYGVQLPQTTVHFGLFKIDEQNQLAGQQTQPAPQDAQSGQTNTSVAQPQPIAAPRPPVPAADTTVTSGTGQGATATQASDGELKLLQQARQASVMLQENYDMVGMSETFEDYMNDLFGYWETQDPCVAIEKALKQTALTADGRRTLEAVVQASRESKKAFQGFSRGELPFDQLKRSLKQHLDEAKTALSSKPQHSQITQNTYPSQPQQTQRYDQQPAQTPSRPAVQPATAAAGSGWGTGFSGDLGANTAKNTLAQQTATGRGSNRPNRAFDDDEEQADGFIRVAADEPEAEPEFGAGRRAVKPPVDDKDIWGEDSGDDKEDSKQDYGARPGQNSAKGNGSALPGAQMLDDEGFDWGEASQADEPPKRTLDWVFDQSGVIKTVDNPKSEPRTAVIQKEDHKGSSVHPKADAVSAPVRGPSRHHQPQNSFGVAPEEQEDSEFMDQKGTVMTEEEKVKLALKNQEIISKPESQQQLNNFFKQPDAPKGPEDVFAKAKRLREAKLQSNLPAVETSKQNGVNSSQRSSLGTKKAAVPMNASSANSVAGSRREPGSPGASVQSIQLKPKPITTKNDSGLKESDIFGEEVFSHRAPYESGSPQEQAATPAADFDPFGGTAVFGQQHEQSPEDAANGWFGAGQGAHGPGFGALQEDDDVFVDGAGAGGLLQSPSFRGAAVPDQAGQIEDSRLKSKPSTLQQQVASAVNRVTTKIGSQGFSEFREDEVDHQLKDDAFSFKKQGTRGSQIGLQDHKSLNESDFFTSGIVDVDPRTRIAGTGNVALDSGVPQHVRSKNSTPHYEQIKPDVAKMELELKVKELEVTVDSLRSQLHDTYDALIKVQADAKLADQTDSDMQARLLQQLEHQLELEKHERTLYQEKYTELSQKLQLERESTSQLHRAFDPKRLIELSKLNDTLLEEKSQMARELHEEKEKSRHLEFFKGELHKTKAELNEVTRMYLAQTAEMSRLQVDKAHIEESVLKELSVLHANQKPKENVNIQTDEYKPEPPEWMKRVTALMDPEGELLNQDKLGLDPKAFPNTDTSQLPDLEKQTLKPSYSQRPSQTPQELDFQSHPSNGYMPDHPEYRDTLPGFSPYGLTINGRRPGAQPPSPHINNSVNESFCQEFLTMFNTAIDTLASRNPTPPPKARTSQQKSYILQEPERRPSQPMPQHQQQAEPFLFEKFGNLYTTTQIPFPSHARSSSDVRLKHGSITPTYGGRDWVTHGWNNTPRSSTSLLGPDISRPLQSPTGLGTWRF